MISIHKLNKINQREWYCRQGLLETYIIKVKTPSMNWIYSWVDLYHKQTSIRLQWCKNNNIDSLNMSKREVISFKSRWGP